MVARLSSVPSFGHRPPGWRWSIRSPRWEPPRSMSRPSVRPSPECSRRTSVGVNDPAGRCGDRPVRHSSSSAIRFPMPATFDWSSSRALSGAADPLQAAASCARVMDSASGPRWSRVGSIRTPPSRLGSCTSRLPPSSKPRMNRSQARLTRRGVYNRCSTLDAPSTNRVPVIPNRMPTTGPPSVSSRRSLPMRRAAVKRFPTNRRRSIVWVAPFFRYQRSGAFTVRMPRPTAVSASRR